METTTHEQAVVTFRQPSELPDHPLLAHIPVWAPHEPEFQALKVSILERGVDYPVLVDSAGRVVDGRNRRNACAAAGLHVPTRQVPEEQVSQIIVSALACRRHMSKSAIAYVLYPLVKEQLDAGTGMFGQPLPKSKRWSDVAAEQIGVNERYLRSAQTIHEQLARRPELRAEVEARVFAEGGCDLSRIAQGNAGREATLDKARHTPQPGALFTRAITDLRNRFTNFWPKIEPTLRLSVADELADTLCQAPEEVRARVLAKLKEAA